MAELALLSLYQFSFFEPRAQILPLEISTPFSGKPTSLDADRSGRFFVTASSSRIATVWFRETEDSWRPTVFRAPLRDEFEPAKYQATIAPNAEYVALSAPPLSDKSGGYQRATARIYVFDRARRNIIATLESEIPTYVTRLRFSPDGQFLAALLSGGCGLRIWAVSQLRDPRYAGAPVFKDDGEYAASNAGKSCCPEGKMSLCEARPRGTDLVFSDAVGDDPWLFALSTSGLTIYPHPLSDGTKGLVFPGEKPAFVSRDQIGLVQPGRLALSSDLSRLAVGDVASPQVGLLRRKGRGYDIEKTFSLKDQLKPDHGAVYLPNLAWMPVEGQGDNEASLIAYGFLPNQDLNGKDDNDETNNIAIFDRDLSRVTLQEIQGQTDTFLYIAKLIDPGFPAKTLFISTERIATIDVSVPRPRLSRVIAENRAISFRGFDEDYRLILDERNNVYFSTVLQGKYRLFNVLFDQMRLVDAAPIDDESELKDRLRTLIARTDHQDRYELSEPKSSRDKWGYDSRVADNPPVFFNRPLPLDRIDPNEVSLAAVKVPRLPGVDELKMVVWGTDRAIRVLSEEGGTVCTRPVRAEAQRMNITTDGQFLVVAHGDGIIRWYALGFSPSNCLPLIMSLYLTQSDDGRWGFLAWLPNGRYAIDGAVGSQRLACYPVELPGRAPGCVDFQQDPSLYDPDAVRSSLRSAPRLRGPSRAAENGPTPSNRYVDASTVRRFEFVGVAHAQTALGSSLANIERAEGAQLKLSDRSPILKHAEQQQTEVEVIAGLAVKTERFSAQVTLSGWNDGKQRYLRFKSGEMDVPVIYNGVRFADGRALPVNPSAEMQVDLELPKALQRLGPIEICKFLYRGINRDGTPADSAGNDLPIASRCFFVKWSAPGAIEPPRSKRKLWALIMGFSKSASNPLQYAHEDALDFARLLAMDFNKKLQGTFGGVSAYDDMKIELFYVPPGDYAPDAILSNPKAKVLLDDLHDQHLDIVVMGKQDSLFSEKVNTTIGVMLGAIATEKAGRSEPWDDEVLVFFAGHGATKNGLVELQTSDPRGPGLNPDVIMSQLNKAQVERRMLILDACRPSPNGDKNDPDLNNIGTKVFNSWTNDHAKWDLLLSTNPGGYSYEESLFALNDIIPGFSLWSPGTIAKTGNGVFTLGFLSSVICGDSVNYPDETVYNADVSSRYLKFVFFSQKNPTWLALEAYLKDKLQASYKIPAPQLIVGGADDASKSFVFRSLDAMPKKCFQSMH
ncbi:hypothetical protein [Bradyrhizobium sp. UFLA05-112]